MAEHDLGSRIEQSIDRAMDKIVDTLEQKIASSIDEAGKRGVSKTDIADNLVKELSAGLKGKKIKTSVEVEVQPQVKDKELAKIQAETFNKLKNKKVVEYYADEEEAANRLTSAYIRLEKHQNAKKKPAASTIKKDIGDIIRYGNAFVAAGGNLDKLDKKVRDFYKETAKKDNYNPAKGYQYGIEDMREAFSVMKQMAENGWDFSNLKKTFVSTVKESTKEAVSIMNDEIKKGSKQNNRPKRVDNSKKIESLRSEINAEKDRYNALNDSKNKISQKKQSDYIDRQIKDVTSYLDKAVESNLKLTDDRIEKMVINEDKIRQKYLNKKSKPISYKDQKSFDEISSEIQRSFDELSSERLGTNKNRYKIKTSNLLDDVDSSIVQYGSLRINKDPRPIILQYSESGDPVKERWDKSPEEYIRFDSKTKSYISDIIDKTPMDPKEIKSFLQFNTARRRNNRFMEQIQKEIDNAPEKVRYFRGDAINRSNYKVGNNNSKKNDDDYFAVNTSNLKLFKPYSEKGAQDYFDFMHELQEFCIQSGKEMNDLQSSASIATDAAKDFDKTQKQRDLYDLFNKAFDDGKKQMDFNAFQDFLKEATWLTVESGIRENGTYNRNALSEFKKQNGDDDIKARLLKRLGYQGVDFVGTSYENQKNTSVIFDAENNIIKSGKEIGEVLVETKAQLQDKYKEFKKSPYNSDVDPRINGSKPLNDWYSYLPLTSNQKNQIKSLNKWDKAEKDELSNNELQLYDNIKTLTSEEETESRNILRLIGELSYLYRQKGEEIPEALEELYQTTRSDLVSNSIAKINQLDEEILGEESRRDLLKSKIVLGDDSDVNKNTLAQSEKRLLSLKQNRDSLRSENFEDLVKQGYSGAKWGYNQDIFEKQTDDAKEIEAQISESLDRLTNKRRELIELIFEDIKSAFNPKMTQDEYDSFVNQVSDLQEESSSYFGSKDILTKQIGDFGNSLIKEVEIVDESSRKLDKTLDDIENIEEKQNEVSEKVNETSQSVVEQIEKPIDTKQIDEEIARQEELIKTYKQSLEMDGDDIGIAEVYKQEIDKAEKEIERLQSLKKNGNIQNNIAPNDENNLSSDTSQTTSSDIQKNKQEAEAARENVDAQRELANAKKESSQASNETPVSTEDTTSEIEAETEALAKQEQQAKETAEAIEEKNNAEKSETSNDSNLKQDLNASQTTDEINKAAEAIKFEGEAAETAAIKKDRFAKANKNVAESGKQTTDEINKAAEAINNEGEAANNRTDLVNISQKPIDRTDKESIDNIHPIVPRNLGEITDDVEHIIETEESGIKTINRMTKAIEKQGDAVEDTTASFSRFVTSTSINVSRDADGNITEHSRSFTTRDRVGTVSHYTRTPELDANGNPTGRYNQNATQQVNYTDIVNQASKALIEQTEVQHKIDEEHRKAVPDLRLLGELYIQLDNAVRRYNEALSVAQDIHRDYMDYINDTTEGTKYILDDYFYGRVAEQTEVPISKIDYKYRKQQVDKDINTTNSYKKKMSSAKESIDYEIRYGNHTEDFVNELEKLLATLDSFEAIDIFDETDIELAEKALNDYRRYNKEGKLSANKLANENSIAKGLTQINSILSGNTKGSFKRSDVYRELSLLKKEFETFDTSRPQSELNALTTRLLRAKADFEDLADTVKGKNFFETFVERLRGANAQLIAQYLSFQDIIRYSRTLATTLIDLDTQLVDLRKTTSMNNDELNEFYHSSADVAKQLGVTTSEIISQASAWSRLGYSSNESATAMAKLSSQFASISPGMSTDEAQTGLVSIMKAWKVDVADVSRDIMDNINTLGNKFAETNLDIVEGMERAGATLSAIGTSVQDSFALFTGAQEVIQNAETVGTALKTLSLRIRGYDEETEELSDDVIEAMGKVADLTKVASNNYAGVSLWADAEQTKYRSLKDYLSDIAKIWNEISEGNRTDLLEKLFGKRGASVGSAILGNFDQIEKAIEEMENAAGSSDREMSIIRDSLEFKLNAIKQEWVETLTTITDRKDFGNILDGILSISEGLGWLISKLGLLQSAIVGVSTVIGSQKLG